MNETLMRELVDRHLEAKGKGDIDGALAVYTFRMLHVFEFRDGLISRENVWLDSAAVVDQLS